MRERPIGLASVDDAEDGSAGKTDMHDAGIKPRTLSVGHVPVIGLNEWHRGSDEHQIRR